MDKQLTSEQKQERREDAEFYANKFQAEMDCCESIIQSAQNKLDIAERGRDEWLRELEALKEQSKRCETG